jgi:hypothetical protein
MPCGAIDFGLAQIGPRGLNPPCRLVRVEELDTRFASPPMLLLPAPLVPART